MYAVAVCEDQKDTREEAAALCGEVLTDLEIEHRIAAFSSAEDLEHSCCPVNGLTCFAWTFSWMARAAWSLQKNCA